MPIVPVSDSRSTNGTGASSPYGGKLEVVDSTWRLNLGGESIEWVSPPAILQDFIAELFASSPQDILSWVHSAAWRLREESWRDHLAKDKRKVLNPSCLNTREVPVLNQSPVASPVFGKKAWSHQTPIDWERGVPNDEKEASASSLKVQTLAVRTAQAPSEETRSHSWMTSRQIPELHTDQGELVKMNYWDSFSQDTNSPGKSPKGTTFKTMGSFSEQSRKTSESAIKMAMSSAMSSASVAKRCTITEQNQYEVYEVDTTPTPSSQEVFPLRPEGTDKEHASTQISTFCSKNHVRISNGVEFADPRNSDKRSPKVTTMTLESITGTTEPREFLKNFNVVGKHQRASSIRSSVSVSLKSNSWSALSPTSKRSFAWTGLFAVCLLLESWVLPMELIFCLNDTYPSWAGAADIFFFSFFTLDIIFCSMTGYVLKSVVYREWPSTFFHYMRRWMWLDIATTMPYLVCIISRHTGSGNEKLAWKWLCLPRLLRLHRVRKWLGRIHLFLPYMRPVMPLIKLQIFLLFAIHVFAVIFAMLQTVQWLESHPDGPYGCYFQCLRWSFVAITLGHTEETAERLWQTLWDLLVSVSRVFFLLTLLEWSKTHSIIRFEKRGSTKSLTAETKLDEERLSAYLCRRGVSPSLQIEVMDALGENEEAQRDQSGRSWVTSQLIDVELRQELKESMWMSKIETLGIMNFLVNCHRSFVAELAGYVDEVVLPPASVVISAGDPTLSAYFILDGRIGVVAFPGALPVPDFTKRMWIGEQALLNPELLAKETLYCRCRTELMGVAAKHFRKLLEENHLVQMYQQFLQETLWMGFCGRCGLFGDHFSKDCPTLGEEGAGTWKGMVSRFKQVGHISQRKKSLKYKNELVKLLSDAGLEKLIAELHRYAIKNVNDLNTAAFDDFLDDEDAGILRSDKEKLRKMVDKLKKKGVEGTAALMSTTAADDHFIFISHYKAEAGTEATLMQRDLEGLIVRDRIFPSQGIVSPVFVDSENLTNLADLQACVLRSYNVVLLLTPGVLSRPWVLVEISLAFRHDINVIPVEIQRPDLKFTYPDEAYLKGIGTGVVLDAACKDLLREENIQLSDLETALRQLFKLIARPFSPHKSNAIRDAELQDVIRRCNLKRPLHATSTSAHAPSSHLSASTKATAGSSPAPMTQTRSEKPFGMRPTKTVRGDVAARQGHGPGKDGVDGGHALSLAAAQAMDRVKMQRQSDRMEFKVGDLVMVTKESRTQGRRAKVVDPDWNGIVKVDMEVPDEKGKTKTFKPQDLVRCDQDKDKDFGDAPSSFKPGDPVRVIKESRTKGKTAVVVEPHWHDLVKVNMDVPDEKGATKSFKMVDLELIRDQPHNPK